MIIGFAHISINTNNPTELISELLEDGYYLSHEFLGLENNILKKKFLNSYSDKHDIFIMEKEDSLNIEITNHGKIFSKNNKIRLNNDKSKLVICTNDSQNLKSNLMENLGFIETQGTMYFKSLIPSWSCSIEIREEEHIKSMLDGEGLTSIAFYVRNIERVASKLVFSDAIYYSGVFNLRTKNKLKIAIIRLKEGLIIELIEIIKDA